MRAAILGAILAPLLTGCGCGSRKPPEPTPSAREPAVWKRYTIPDGTCSAEFPSEPHSSENGLDLVPSDIYAGRPFFILTCEEIPIIPEGITDDALLDLMRDRGRDGLINPNNTATERKILVDRCIGREWDDHPEFPTVRMKVVIRGGKIYLAAGIRCWSEHDRQDVTRFLASFRFEEPKP
jgi:hypothetical protein